MSIFVTDVPFDITIRYQVLRRGDSAITGVQILRPDSPEGEELKCTAVAPDYETMAKVLEESTVINHITGAPMIRTMEFNKLVLTKFFRTWTAVDATGAPTRINYQTINKTHYPIVRALVRAWLRAIKGDNNANPHNG